MRTKEKLALALLAGIGIVGPSHPNLYAQQSKSPPAYVISNIYVTDPSGYKKFLEAVPATLAPYHASFLVRGGRTEAFAGEDPQRIVVIAFQNMEDAVRWRRSAEYMKVKELALTSARDISSYAVEGLAAQQF